MDGTTLCPHCDTRFKIDAEQLVAHQGMVRCGNCMQVFDALPHFVPDQPDPQMALPIAEVSVPADKAHLQPEAEETKSVAEPAQPAQEKTPALETVDTLVTDAGAHRIMLDEFETLPVHQHTLHADVDIPEAQGMDPTPTARNRPESIKPVAKKSLDLSWLWTLLVAIAMLMMLSQATYFFRSGLAARLPGIKPVLLGFCSLLHCTIPLPQNADLMSIESSDLEIADAAHDNKITLNALLRNRASYAQAYPDLELTLNDSMDKPLARRVFHPVDYLPDPLSIEHGLLSEHEISIKLQLDTHNLAPVGYRLALLYSDS